jgi:hypothetical protein
MNEVRRKEGKIYEVERVFACSFPFSIDIGETICRAATVGASLFKQETACAHR